MNAALEAARAAQVSSLGAKAVLLLIALRHHPDTGRCVPSLAALGRETGLDPARLERAIGLLIEQGHMRREGRGFVITQTEKPTGNLPAPARSSAAPPPGGQAAMPADDWTPSPHDVEAIRKEFPHHDATDEILAEITREWIDYSQAHGRTYVEPGRAWRNSARLKLKDRTSSVRNLSGRRGGSNAGGVSGAVAGLRGD